MMKYLIALFCCLLLGCQSPDKEITPAFYHWKTNLSLTNSETNYLKNLSVKKIFVKFFDVDWNGAQQQPLPVAEVQLDSTNLQNLEIIPTIFITNRSLKNYPLEKMNELGNHILEKIFSIKKNVQEIQIDCDWSETTQEKYFALLSFLGNEVHPQNIQLSATIRLHQVKYFERTGVPPVDRGMLMFYNMDAVKDWETKNSILNLEVAKQYFYNFKKYPLDLDVALPIFSWGIIFRGGKLIYLMNNLRVESLADTTFFQPMVTQDFEGNPTRFEVVKSTYLDGKYLYAGDKIRLENISIKQLNTSATLLKNQIHNPNFTVSFYHLDTATIKHFSYEKLQNVIQNFTQ